MRKEEGYVGLEMALEAIFPLVDKETRMQLQRSVAQRCGQFVLLLERGKQAVSAQQPDPGDLGKRHSRPLGRPASKTVGLEEGLFPSRLIKHPT